MDIRIKMTEDEQKEFETMSEEQQQAFFEAVKTRREQLMLKTAVASAFLIECFDNLEEVGLLKHSLKQSGKVFKTKLEKYVNDIFDANEDDVEGSNYIEQGVLEIHKIF